MKRHRIIAGLLAALALAAAWSGAAIAQDRPERVVSMNVCTDQLAMLLAAPGQLYSVSDLAVDARTSAMAEQAQAYPLNHGQAEEIYLMQPDLVVAGAFTARAAVDMLRRLGLKVVVFPPAYSLDDVRDRIATMGAALGQEDKAAETIAAFDAGLAALRDEVTDQPRAALYEANGYTTGDKTLAGEILHAAGFANVAAEAGYANGGYMPLEVLAMSAPDIVITGSAYPGASRAEELLDHPAVAHLRDTRAGPLLSDHDWVCGTPFVLRAIAGLRDARQRLEAGR